MSWRNDTPNIQDNSRYAGLSWQNIVANMSAEIEILSFLFKRLLLKSRYRHVILIVLRFVKTTLPLRSRLINN